MAPQKYVPPLEPDVADAVILFNAAAREFSGERAAIRDFDAGLPRAQAEVLALEDTRRYLAQLPLRRQGEAMAAVLVQKGRN